MPCLFNVLNYNVAFIFDANCSIGDSTGSLKNSLKTIIEHKTIGK